MAASPLHIARMDSCSDSDSPVHKKRKILSSEDSVQMLPKPAVLRVCVNGATSVSVS